MSNNKYSFNYGELISLRKNLVFVKNIFGFFGFWFYLLALTFPSESFPAFKELECKENNSYIIINRESLDSKDYFKKYPAKFVENLEQKLKIFIVSYDLNKRIGNLNGSKFMLTFGNLEKLEKVQNKSLITSLDSENFNGFEDSISVKGSLVPIILFKSSNNYKQETRDYFNQDGRDSKFDKLDEINNLSTNKKFFTIEDAYSNNPEFTFINISNQENNFATISSNDKLTEKFDFKKVIEISRGECKLLKNKNR